MQYIWRETRGLDLTPFFCLHPLRLGARTGASDCCSSNDGRGSGNGRGKRGGRGRGRGNSRGKRGGGRGSAASSGRRGGPPRTDQREGSSSSSAHGTQEDHGAMAFEAFVSVRLMMYNRDLPPLSSRR